MQKPSRTILLLIIVVSVLGISSVMLTWRPDNVQSHLARLNRIKSTGQTGPFRLKHYLYADTWLWYLHGRPTTERWKLEALDEEWNALIRLGYFEIREFPLQRRAFDARFFGEMLTEVHHAPTGFLKDRNFRTFRLGSTPPNIARLAVCKEDVARFEWIVRSVDARQ
jgi:hypothetical protein